MQLTEKADTAPLHAEYSPAAGAMLQGTLRGERYMTWGTLHTCLEGEPIAIGLSSPDRQFEFIA